MNDEQYAQFVHSRTSEHFSPYVPLSSFDEQDLNAGEKEYQRITLSMHAAVGIVTEAGELLDAFKKSFSRQKPINWVNTHEEVGDLLFYVQMYCNANNISMFELMKINQGKLELRHPNGFDAESSINRDLDKELAFLEGSITGQELIGDDNDKPR